MGAFALNTKHVNIESTDRTEKPSFKGVFYIHSELEDLPINGGDNIVLLEPIRKDYRFTGYGHITKVGPIQLVAPLPSYFPSDKPKKDEYLHFFDLEIENELQKDNLLTDVEYSLTVVYNYNNPISHFAQQFRSLINDDYETIVNNWIYSARTVFGKLINAIPRQNKLEFMLQSMNHFSTIDFTHVPLQEGLIFLNRYLEERILSRGRLLVETNKIIKDRLSDLLPLDRVGFVNPTNNKENTLEPQAAIFEDLFSLDSKMSLAEMYRLSNSDSPIIEGRFSKLFESKTWPIDLNERRTARSS